MADVSNPRVGQEWSVATDYTQKFLSPTNYILKPEIRAQIFDVYREDTLFDFLIHSGRRKRSGNQVFRHHEFDSILHLHTVESFTGTTGAGNPATITLEEADHLDDSTANNLSQIKEKDVVMVYTSTGVIRGYVTDVDKGTPDAHTATIDPIDDTVDLVSAIANGDKVAIMTNAHSDGAGQSDATARRPVNFYNYMEIFDVTKRTDGSESANEAFVVVDGKPYYYNQLVIDGDLEIRLKMEAAFVFGTRALKAGADPETGKDVYFTGGLEFWADNEGYSEPYSSNFALSDLENVCRNLDLERASNKHMFLVGNELDMDLDSFVKGQFDNATNASGSLNFTNWGIGNAASRIVDFGIDGFRFNNREFMKKKYDAFNYIGMTAATDSPYPGMGFTIPWDTIRDPKSQDDVDSICLRYKENDRGSRFMKYWERDQKITNKDQIEFCWKAEAGIQIARARWINKVYAG